MAATTSQDSGPRVATESAISIQDLTVYFHKQNTRITAVSGVDFDVRPGGFVSILGPSGCGKSTILNCVAGLEKPSLGRVLCGGAPVTGVNAGVGYLTQRDALLPWRTVEQNVRLPFEIRGQAGASRLRRKPPEHAAHAARVQWAIEMVGLGGFGGHYPHELSGGMLKRASLAQVLASAGDLMLMDEPFGALDAQLKLQMHRELIKVWNERRSTVLFVTHDIEEAVALSDVIILLAAHPGRIKAVIDVDLPRDRDPVDIRFDPHFRELHERIWSMLEIPSIEEEEEEMKL